jgi:glycosyltransferase involved in cell wall biosynthesis
VVSSAIPSVCAYLPGGEAILIDGNRPNEIADALLWMKRDPEGRIAMGRQARARAEQLSWYNVAGEFAALYRKLCA